MAGPGSVDPTSPFFSSIAGQSALAGQKAHQRDDKKKVRAASRPFDRLVRDELEESQTVAPPLAARFIGLAPEKVLEILLDEVHTAGDLLKEKPLPDNIIAYKDAVRSFIKHVVDRAFTVTEQISGGNILKRKKFTQVQVIDQKLEQLAAGILSNQRSQLDLLERIEEINGLLVDLLS